MCHDGLTVTVTPLDHEPQQALLLRGGKARLPLPFDTAFHRAFVPNCKFAASTLLVSAVVFVVYTGCETWANPHCSPAEALTRHRAATGIDAKLIVAAMAPGGLTLADPGGAGMMGVVGFDASAPEAMRQFVRNLKGR